MHRILFLLILFATTTVQIIAQTQPPSTDIYLVDITRGQGSLKFGTSMNITNRPGYDNQPSFAPDGSYILYTAMQNDLPRPQASAQTEIYRYNIVAKTVERVTRTMESEYSATVMPGGSSFSVVRVEPDSTQRLWKFEMSGQNPAIILRNIKPVGYHAWVDSNTVALFVLGSPATLQLTRVNPEKADTIIGGIGRSLHKIPGKRAISFVHKVSEKEWWIKELDVATRAMTPLIQTLAGSEDYAWTPDGTIMMGQGSKLFSYKPGTSKEWMEIADFSSTNIKGITRIAVSPMGNRLAFVALE